VSANAPLVRSDHCAVFVGGRLYLVGGYDTSYNILNSTEVYDPATRRFTRGSIPDLPSPRGDVGCNVVGSVIFVHGGYFDPSGTFLGGMHRNTTWALDTANVARGWVRKADMNVARGDHAFAVLSGGRLLVMGGENNPDNTNDKTPVRSVEMYNIADDAWSEKAPLQYARFRFGAGVISSPSNGDSAVFAFGGHELCLNSGQAYSAANLTALQAMNSCASNAADTLSVFSNLVHPDVYVYLKN
jgi:N-acetylneuraminic acid mutarotase